MSRKCLISIKTGHLRKEKNNRLIVLSIIGLQMLKITKKITKRFQRTELFAIRDNFVM